MTYSPTFENQKMTNPNQNQLTQIGLHDQFPRNQCGTIPYDIFDFLVGFFLYA